MQRVATCTAEDSCFIKYHSQNGGDGSTVSPNSQTHDIEKAEVEATGGPIQRKPVIEIQPPPKNQNEKGILGQTNQADSDNSSLDDEKDDFPEGGLRGWSVVIGSFCGTFSVFGIINSTAILLEYFSTHQLKDYSASQIGWIFGLSLFLTFFCGAPIGPIFDAYGPRTLIFSGSLLLVASMFLLGLCTRTWTCFGLFRMTPY